MQRLGKQKVKVSKGSRRGEIKQKKQDVWMKIEKQKQTRLRQSKQKVKVLKTSMWQRRNQIEIRIRPGKQNVRVKVMRGSRSGGYQTEERGSVEEN